MPPRISILTPSYNYQAFLRDALDSVQQQAIPAEHIVMDGASTDGTAEVLAAYPSERLRWASEPDEGQSDALNKALRLATGTWVGWLNADEFYLPHTFELVEDALTSSMADVVYGDCAFVDRDGRLLRLLPQHGMSPWLLRHYGIFTPSCTLFVRRSILPADPWDPHFRRIMDWDFVLGLLDRGASFHHVRAPLGAFRVHDEQVTASPSSVHAEEYGAIRARYGIADSPTLRRAARVGHASKKLIEGAYLRQVRARRLRGAGLRWFAGQEGRETCGALANR